MVGRRDGTVEPFFAVHQGREIYSCGEQFSDELKQAVFGGDSWWWHRMEVPTIIPSQEFLDSLPRDKEWRRA